MGQNREELAQSKISYPEIEEIPLPKGIDLHQGMGKGLAAKIHPLTLGRSGET